MPKMTLLSRVSDGLPLAASMEDEKDHRELDAYKAQAKKIIKTLSSASPGKLTIESGGSTFQCAATSSTRLLKGRLRAAFLAARPPARATPSTGIRLGEHACAHPSVAVM